MNILSRSQAMSQGLKKYFTGKPCRNNHVASRYVQSGTCEQCINGSPATTVAPLSNERKLKIEGNKEARKYLIRVKLVVPHRFVGKLRDFAYLLTALRDSRIAYEDVSHSELASFAVGASMGRYTLSVHPEDYETVSAYAEELKEAGGFQKITVEPGGEATAIALMEEQIRSRRGL